MKNISRKKCFSAILLLAAIICLFPVGQAYYQSAHHKRQQGELAGLKRDYIISDAEDEDKPPAASDGEPRDGDGSVTYKPSEKPADIPGIQTSPEAVAYGPQKPAVLKEYEKLCEINSDMIGWITVEGTRIDYPVMKRRDNEYYLYHDFYGEESKYGSLFVKDIADEDKGTNVIIYGHNMKDGAMFGELDGYMEESFYKEHRQLRFDTLYEERTYEIVSVFLSQVYRKDEDVFKYYQFYEAENEAEFNDFYQNIKELSLYDTGVEAEYGDTFVTLSTCAYHVEDGRLAVVAKRIQ